IGRTTSTTAELIEQLLQQQ
ncbi:unnamed protein product, partial [Rotaria magnacalcarata]